MSLPVLKKMGDTSVHMVSLSQSLSGRNCAWLHLLSKNLVMTSKIVTSLNTSDLHVDLQ